MIKNQIEKTKDTQCMISQINKNYTELLYKTDIEKECYINLSRNYTTLLNSI